MLSMACGSDDDPIKNSTSSNGGNGGNGGSGTTTTTTSPQGGSGAGVTTGGMGGGTPATYPPGPYGKQVGEIFPYLEWEGYVSTDAAALATTEPWTDTYTSLDLYMSAGGYALVHTSLST
jgi:hypothetical protein